MPDADHANYLRLSQPSAAQLSLPFYQDALARHVMRETKEVFHVDRRSSLLRVVR